VRDEQGTSHTSGQSTGSHSTGQVTTHGLGTGQSIDRAEDLRRGQEFGQGEEQVSNYKGNETKRGSEAAQQSGDRQEGELR
jgi:hypothetical protein